MLPQAKLDRLNAQAQKQKEGQLTPAEQNEQKLLRAEYIQSFRSRVAADLEAQGMEQKPAQGCACGCRHKH
ncbi:MAG: DUF896 domain-containing protein [Selenomonadales bacterium]|nr:DUF896 domain-containing protein [Selenomonadales bacterium]